MKISFLILLLSISINTLAGERLEGISGSMGKSTGLFSKIFGEGTENTDIDDNSIGQRQRDEITVESKRQAEQDASQLKEGERHSGIKDNSAKFAPEQEKKSADVFPEIDLIAAVNTEFEDTINKLEAAERKVITKPTQLFPDNSHSLQTANKANPIQTANDVATIQPTNQDCVQEKVYSLDVENAAQYKRLEDFPFTYECVTQR